MNGKDYSLKQVWLFQDERLKTVTKPETAAATRLPAETRLCDSVGPNQATSEGSSRDPDAACRASWLLEGWGGHAASLGTIHR